MDRRSFLRTPLLALAAYTTARKVAPVSVPVVPEPELLKQQLMQEMSAELRQMITASAYVGAVWFAR
jgi:hypothetical protein